MPTYVFRNRDTREEKEIFMSISQLDDYRKNNLNEELVIGVSKFISGYGLKPDNGFRDVLKKIKKANPRSKINDF